MSASAVDDVRPLGALRVWHRPMGQSGIGRLSLGGTDLGAHLPTSHLCERKFIFDANRSEFTLCAILTSVGLCSSGVEGARVLRATRHAFVQGAYVAIDVGPTHCDESASANLTGCIVCIRRGGVIEGR